jgi:lipopolysaccharide/colanic/teichoic acid biosynthesis glycosyltransferase
MPRMFDFILAVVAIVLLAPLFAVVVFLVRMGLGAPVLFIQSRSGRAGRPFQLIKLRSMHDASDALGGPLPDAGRTPAIGRFLRRTRLDELPELINILRGDMAFVGPRPLLPGTIDSLGSLGQLRGSVRPGLTGWAQVNGNAMLTLQQKIALDLWYIANRSVSLDLEIIFKTVGVVMLGERINTSRLEDAVEGRNRRGC